MESPQGVDEVILYVDDLERSVAFYRDVLRLPVKFAEHGYAEFSTRGAKLGLYERDRLADLIGPEGAGARPQGEVLFLVPDVGEWAGRLGPGVRILSGPTDRPWGQRTLHLCDPDGHVVELAQEIPRTRPRGDGTVTG